MKKRFLSLFCVLALCLGLLPTTALADAVVVVPPGGGDGDISVDVNPDEPGNVTVIVPGEDGGDVVVVIPPEEEEAPVIGDVVNFAGHEWYIIGDETAGVIAPEGCYTLFAKNNDFGSTAFRTEENGGSIDNSTACNYQDSDLYNKMNAIAEGFSDEDKANIFPRAKLDEIKGDLVTDQLLWPIGRNEASSLQTTIRQFETIYWGRTGEVTDSGATQVFDPATGQFVGEVSEYSYSVYAYNTDGSERWESSAGVLGSRVSTATKEYAVRPALYVSAEAFTGGAEASPVIGDTVSFAGHEWYIIGTGIGGVTAPAGCYTLFAKNNEFGTSQFNSSDAYSGEYPNSVLQQKMKEIANGSLSEYTDDIVARNELDNIIGDSPADQLLWPLSESETDKVSQEIRAFEAEYWTRSATGTSYFMPRVITSSGAVINKKSNDSYAVRPALYVKAEAVGAPKVTVPLTGGKVYFGSQDWYIVGMDDVGPVPGPSKTVTLFADSNIEDQYVSTSINYSEGDLCAAMKKLEGPLNLSAQAQSLIFSRILTAADEITGDSVTTPFWPLSKSEFEAIQAENSSLLTENLPYWLRTPTGTNADVYTGTANGSLGSNPPTSTCYVRPAFYLDLSTLFFAAGESSMGNSVNGNPVKLMPPGTDSSQKRWNFVMYDRENLSLTMSAEQGQSGQSLTFQYSGTGGPYHYLAYVLEQDGVPVYYGNAASLKDSGTGTVTVPLLGSSSKLEDGDYTMRFYEEDRTDGIYFASDTVDLEIRVADGVASITNLGDVAVHTHSFGTELKYDENYHWKECSCGAKTTPQAHEYSGDQDKTCMYCGYEREVVHVHTLNWLYDSTGHWQECFFCGEKVTSVESHVYDNDQDDTCNVCGYERQPPHSHDFGPGWKSDAFAHWQECSCGEKTTAEAHSYDGDQDAECNICGYEREISHTHDFGTDWESDAFNHWHKCSTCGAKDAEAAHTYDSEEDAECNVCGYKRDLSHTHTYSNSWDCDTSSHWHACIYCGEKEAEAAHVYDNDLDTECNICKFKREISHIHQGVLVPGTPATCTQEGSKAYYTCTCEQAFEDKACTKPIANLDSWKVIPSKDHTWSESYLAVNADAQKHYLVCAVCGARDAGEAHTWNAESATEQNEKHCTICGYERLITPPVSQEYTVTFNANGGSVTPSSAVTTDGKLTSLPTPICAGYDFVGWYTAASGGQPVTTGTVFTSDTTLYAHWQKRDSGSGSPGDADSEPSYSVSLPGRVEGGGITVNKRYAEEGETFRFTVTPDEGYELERIAVINSRGREIDLSYTNGEYRFIMPAGRVEIEVSFREIEVELPFTDVPEGAWYADAAAYVYEHGLMAGTSATTFAPDVTTSRAMIATILWRMAGSPVVNYAMDYTDVAQNQWCSEAIRWATSEGIVGGYGNGLFGTNDPITREQFAVMLYRFAQAKGYDVSIGEDTNILSYTDVADLSEYAIPAMQWAVGAGIINGTGDGSTLSPQGQATRAQAAVMLMRFCEEYVTW